MSDQWWLRRTWKAYNNEAYNRPFCYNCPVSLTGFLANELTCYILDKSMSVANRPECTEADWIKYLIENM